MDIRVIDSAIDITEIEKIAKNQFGNLVKATVDIQKRTMALGGELHADEEQLLLEGGSSQTDLWGINLYPGRFGKPGFIEFDSMINIRPSQKNMSRGIEDPDTRRMVKEVVNSLIRRA